MGRAGRCGVEGLKPAAEATQICLRRSETTNTRATWPNVVQNMLDLGGRVLEVFSLIIFQFEKEQLLLCCCITIWSTAYFLASRLTAHEFGYLVLCSGRHLNRKLTSLVIPEDGKLSLVSVSNNTIYTSKTVRQYFSLLLFSHQFVSHLVVQPKPSHNQPNYLPNHSINSTPLTSKPLH